jgi:hypothetical protein
MHGEGVLVVGERGDLRAVKGAQPSCMQLDRKQRRWDANIHSFARDDDIYVIRGNNYQE